MGLNLITLAQYKTHEGINSTNYDQEVTDLIPRISNFVKAYCRKTFIDYVDTPKVDIFDGGFNTILLPESPVLEVVSVEFSEDYGQTYAPLAKYIDWVVQGDQLRSLAAIGYFPPQINGYKVTYKAGYVNLPEDMLLACFDLINYYRQNNSAVHSSKAPGTNKIQIEYISTSSLPANIKRILDLYKADFL